MLRLKEDFGAACDGVICDDVSMAGALAEWSDCGGELVIEGMPLLTQPFQVDVLKDARLVGSGTILWSAPQANDPAWAGNPPPLRIDVRDATPGQSPRIPRFVMEGVAWQCETLGTQVGVVVGYPSLPSGTYQGPQIRDVSGQGRDVSLHAWRTALRLERAWNSEVHKLHVKGQDDGYAPFDGDCGLELFECMDAHVLLPFMYHVENAIRTAGQRTEGLTIRGGRLVGVGRPLYVPATTYKTAWLDIAGVHANSYYGARLENLSQFRIAGNHSYKSAPAANYWRGWDLAGCEIGEVVGNELLAPGCSPQFGNDCIVAVDCSAVTVRRNYGGQLPTPGALCILAGASSACTVEKNRYGANCSGVYNWASGPGNVVT